MFDLIALPLLVVSPLVIPVIVSATHAIRNLRRSPDAGGAAARSVPHRDG